MMMQQGGMLWADLQGDIASKYHGGIGSDGHAARRDAPPQVAESLHQSQGMLNPNWRLQGFLCRSCVGSRVMCSSKEVV